MHYKISFAFEKFICTQHTESGTGSVEEVQLGVSATSDLGKETVTVNSEDSVLPQVISVINKRQKVSFLFEHWEDLYPINDINTALPFHLAL